MATSLSPPESLALSILSSPSSSSSSSPASVSSFSSFAAFPYRMHSLPLHNHRLLPSRWFHPTLGRGGYLVLTASAGLPLTPNSVLPKEEVYTVGDFMTVREDLHVVKPTTTVDEALEMLVENRITGFPVIDDDWKLVGLVSDYDLLALDSISGGGVTDTDIFPEVDSTWKTFNEVQKLLSKTNGKLVGDLMTPAPIVVRDSTNLEDAASILLETNYRRLPVVDGDGKLVGIITRGNVVAAALQLKRIVEG
ncbi:CBS domain-containing protein CBSX1, chloroplastic-like [Impatiens glandulifera]|uniref:CBS domain-containing protein CBSX1, chloroplastic-like n=1 Tax=Impatiens glandulifera TaxID=253017 RepID=UPI001FB1504C|nr:CBS domain-containing protein CBSX1, chloroplastic-like [Impatiens glandulifera]